MGGWAGAAAPGTHSYIRKKRPRIRSHINAHIRSHSDAHIQNHIRKLSGSNGFSSYLAGSFYFVSLIRICIQLTDPAKILQNFGSF